MAGLDPDLFRRVMSTFPAGVTVVTSQCTEGGIVGFTATSVCSVSIEPPLVLVCVDNNSNSLPEIRHFKGFTINILEATQVDVARLFANKGAAKGEFEAGRPSSTVSGPILQNESCAYLECALHKEVEAGDHHILLGEVLSAKVDESRVPLMYAKREFRSWPES